MNTARQTLTEIYTTLKSDCETLLATPDADARKTSAVIDITHDCDAMLSELSDDMFDMTPSWDGSTSKDAIAACVAASRCRLLWLKGDEFVAQIDALIESL